MLLPRGSYEAAAAQFGDPCHSYKAAAAPFGDPRHSYEAAAAPFGLSRHSYEAAAAPFGDPRRSYEAAAAAPFGGGDEPQPCPFGLASAAAQQQQHPLAERARSDYWSTPDECVVISRTTVLPFLISFRWARVHNLVNAPMWQRGHDKRRPNLHLG